MCLSRRLRCSKLHCIAPERGPSMTRQSTAPLYIRSSKQKHPQVWGYFSGRNRTRTYDLRIIKSCPVVFNLPQIRRKGTSCGLNNYFVRKLPIGIMNRVEQSMNIRFSRYCFCVGNIVTYYPMDYVQLLDRG